MDMIKSVGAYLQY